MMLRICAVLPCSAALARKIHHPDIRRVISWGLGNIAATRGISMKGKRHAEASSPFHSVYTLDRTNTHKYNVINVLYALANPAHCAHVFWQLNRLCMSNHLGARSILFLKPHLKHVAQPITANRCHYNYYHTPVKKNTCVRVTIQ